MFTINLYIFCLLFTTSIYAKLQCAKWWMWKCPHEAKCVELYSVCDGVKDCFFGGDEGKKLCTERFCKRTLGGRWKCPNEAKCIFEFQVCDSHNDCDDGSDENDRYCTKDVCDNSGRWKCPNEKKCINHDLVCDKLADCEDGADETEEACNEACQLRGEIACIQNEPRKGSTGNKCMQKEHFCATEKDFFGGQIQTSCKASKKLKEKLCL